MIIKGTRLKMIRGDTETFEIVFTDEYGDPFFLEKGDTIYFSVKSNIRHTREEIYIRKRIETPTDRVLLTIEPEDTNRMKPKDDYLYDIQLTQRDGTVTTLVGPDYFTLIGDVTRD